MTPRVRPKGLRFPPVEETESTNGRSGQMQGARMVAKPAKKLKKRRNAMGTPLFLLAPGITSTSPNKVTDHWETFG